MNGPMRRLVLTLSLVCTPALAGETLTWQRQRADEPATTLTMKCEGANARFEGTGAKGRIVIWDATARTMNVLTPDTRTYSQVSEAQLKSMRESLSTRLEKLPPEQRARAEAALSQLTGADAKTPARWDFKPTGKKAKVGKWDCELYDARRGESLAMQFCLVPWDKAPVKRTELECLKSFSDMFGSLARNVAADGAAADDYSAFPGLPVQSSRALADGKKAVSTLTDVTRGPIAADQFVVPGDYALKNDLGLKAGSPSTQPGH